MLAIYCMGIEQYWAAGFFLVLKSVLDEADGQLARVKNQPSYTGRYGEITSQIFENQIPKRMILK